MLVLSRKPGEKVVIGEDVILTVLEVIGNRVRIGIKAPDHIRILRGELACWLDLDEGRPDSKAEGARRDARVLQG